MGLTLDELKLIEKTISDESWDSETIDEAFRLIKREIKLKELEKQIPKMDISGTGMEE